MIKKIHISPLIIFLTILFSACKENKTKTYFGGKIINPKSKKVVLYAMDEVIDTLYINKYNRFLNNFKNVNEGLYYFIHGNESQYIYLEPNDSLMIRLNTWDFDESLVFTGKGSERNNILIDCFLDDESDKRLFYKYFSLKPNEFKNKVDSLLNEKLLTYNEFVQSHPNETNKFKKVLKIALTYPLYARMERYPIENVYYTKSKDFQKIPDNFYDYRKYITTNNDSLMYYTPYSSYVRNFLYNKTFTLGHKPMMTEYSTDFTVDLLNTIHKEIVSKEIKNVLLKQTVIQHFYRKSNLNYSTKYFDTFLELSSNKKDKDHVINLINDAKFLSKGKKIIDFSVRDYLKTSHSINDIIKNKNSLLFFWNPKYISENYISSRMKFLINKYPNINFIQIKIGKGNVNRIGGLDIKNQFYIDSKSKANQFLKSELPRAIVVNEKGLVISGFTSISSKNLYPYLNEIVEK